jgi:hypothetical protein
MLDKNEAGQVTNIAILAQAHSSSYKRGTLIQSRPNTKPTLLLTHS